MTDTRTFFTRRTILVSAAGMATAALLAACGETNTLTSAPTNSRATNTIPATATSNVTMNTVSPLMPTPPAATPGSLAATPTRAPASRQIGVEYWHASNGVQITITRDLVQRFNDANLGITVTERTFPNFTPLLQALQSALAAKTSPAVSQIAYNYLRYVATNGFPYVPLEDVAKRDTRGNDFVMKNFAPATLELGRINGVLQGIPYSIAVPVLFYNADLLRQAMVERPPRTWPEVRENARAIKDRTGKPGIGLDLVNNFWLYQTFIEGNGAQLLAGSGKALHCGIDSTEAIEAVQFMQDLVLKDKTAANLSQDEMRQAFIGGEIAMWATSAAQIGNIQQGAKFSAGTALFPLWGTKPRKAPVGGASLYVFATGSEQQAASWEWIKFLLSPESLTTWVQGTGILSPRTGLAEDPKYLKPYFDMNPLVKPALDELPDVVPWISFPGKSGLQVPQDLYDAVQMTLAGADVASTLKTVAQHVDQEIQM